MADDFDITSNFHGGNAESEVAFNTGKKKHRYFARRIVSYAAEKGRSGVTANELYYEFGGSPDPALSKISISGCGARLSEMSFGKYGPELLMIPIEEHRITRAGCPARVHVTPFVHYLMRVAGDPAANYVKKRRSKK
jgi:hypothetical protein